MVIICRQVIPDQGIPISLALNTTCNIITNVSDEIVDCIYYVDLSKECNRVFLLGNSGNSVKDKGLTNIIMYVERNVFTKGKI